MLVMMSHMPKVKLRDRQKLRLGVFACSLQGVWPRPAKEYGRLQFYLDPWLHSEAARVRTRLCIILCLPTLQNRRDFSQDVMQQEDKLMFDPLSFNDFPAIMANASKEAWNSVAELSPLRL